MTVSQCARCDDVDGVVGDGVHRYLDNTPHFGWLPYIQYFQNKKGDFGNEVAAW